MARRPKTQAFDAASLLEDISEACLDIRIAFHRRYARKLGVADMDREIVAAVVSGKMSDLDLRRNIYQRQSLMQKLVGAFKRD